MIRTQDLGALGTILHPDAVFRSPNAIDPYQSADAVTLALTTVIKVLDNFAYHREFATDDGLNVVLEFSASVGDKLLKGADFVRFDEDGKIIELEVMIRPLDALQALGQETRKRLGHKLADHKVSLWRSGRRAVRAALVRVISVAELLGPLGLCCSRRSSTSAVESSTRCRSLSSSGPRGVRRMGACRRTRS